jgi:hypothetical protein
MSFAHYHLQQAPNIIVEQEIAEWQPIAGAHSSGEDVHASGHSRRF